MIDIAVVDYGMGNLRSVSKAVEHVAPGLRVVVTQRSRRGALRRRRVVFPGQGAMPDCMRELDARGLRPAVLEAARSKPFLGICIGLQMLFELSEEGDVPGLGLLAGPGSALSRATRWSAPTAQSSKSRTWAGTKCSRRSSIRCGSGIAQGSRFYFVHSYYPAPRDRDLIAGYSLYPFPFTCAVAQG